MPDRGDDDRLSCAGDELRRKFIGQQEVLSYLIAMAKHASELSLAELSEAASAAAEEAVHAALSRGVAVTGLLSDGNGKLRLGRRNPDGSIEWLEASPSAHETISSPVKIAG